MQQIKNVTVNESLFGFGNRIRYFIPKLDRIPKEFYDPENKWNKLCEDWWKNGLNKNLRFFVKDNLSNEAIKKYINGILNTHGSFIKKEHKVASASYLLSQWLENFSFI